jgi:hypothetical protein
MKPVALNATVPYKVITERWPDPHERGVDLGFPNS